MKPIAFLFSLLMVLVFSAIGNAASFQLISTINSINGNLNVSYYDESGYTNVFDDTYRATSFFSLHEGTRYSTEFGEFHALSTASFNEVFVDWDAYGWSESLGVEALAVAESKTVSVFRPRSLEEMNPITFIDTSSWTHTFAWAEIKDLTTNEMIFTTYPHDPGYFHSIHTFSYSGWKSDHQYQLTMQVWGGDANLSQSGGISTDLSFVTVPEPGTLILLLAGLFGLAAVKRPVAL